MKLPTFTPPAKFTLSDSIAKYLETLIVEGTLKPGETLPPERELAQRLSVSRPSLREALLKLEAKGLLQGRRGGGTKVVDVYAPTLIDPLVHILKTNAGAMTDILELRHALEEVASYYAALRATEEDIKQLKRCCQTARSVRKDPDPTRFAEADAEFHLSIADASHNVPLIYVMRGLFNLLRSSSSEWRHRFSAQEENVDFIHEQHETLFKAILRRDADAARAAARLHLDFIGETLDQIDAEKKPRKRPAQVARRKPAAQKRA